MRIKMKILLAGSILAAGTIGTMTAFGATSASHTSGTNITKQHVHQQTYQIGGIKQIAQILNLDQATLKADIAKGQTLAEIAQTQGVSEQALITDIESNLKTNLDHAVQSGKITSDKEQQFLNKFESHIQQFVEQPMKEGFQQKGTKRMGLNLTNLASTLGIDKATLVSDLQNGESLVDIAQSKGISEQTLVNDLLSPAKNRLDQAVAAGTMTNTQEQQILSKMQNRITSRITKHYNANSTSTQAPGQSV